MVKRRLRRLVLGLLFGLTAHAALAAEQGKTPASMLSRESHAAHEIYAFNFGQKGLMAGIGIQGNKITKIDPN